MTSSDELNVEFRDVWNPDYRSVWLDLHRVRLTQDYVEVNGVSTRYVRAGRRGAPVLLMLHGTAGTWETFSGNLEAHAEHFDCIAFDMLGSGFTGKPDRDYEISDYVEHTRGLMDALGVSTASFIGVSLGGWIAAAFGVAHPDRTDKLILLSIAGLVSDRATMQRIASGRGRITDDPSWERCFDLIGRLVYSNDSIVPDVVAIRRAEYLQPEMSAAMAHILSLTTQLEVRDRNNIPEEKWRALAAPTLLIAAIDSKDIWLETALRVAELIPDVSLIEMREVGHWPHFEKPAEFNAVSVPFLLGSSH